MIYNTNVRNNSIPFPMQSAMPQPTRDVNSPLPSKGRVGIGITPGAVIGALIGGSVAAKQAKKQEFERLKQEQLNVLREQPVVEGNYYQQVHSVVNNLSIVFTPVSAIYVVRNGKKDFTLDTIEVSEMNSDMKLAWQNKDQEYFKGLMLSKMLTEMQVAEQSFAKRFLKKQFQMRDIITKDASDTSIIDDMMEFEVLSSTEAYSGIYKSSEEKECLASAMIDDIENESETMYISASLDRPFDKYAGFITGIKDALGFGVTDKDSLAVIKNKMSNPTYVMKNIKVGFFPDRVVFSLGNQLVSTMSLLSMNEEGYQHFEKQDAMYFKHLFAENVKDNLKKQADIVLFDIQKTAASEEQETIVDVMPHDCLRDSSTHPVIIYLLLVSRFGMEWLTYDIGAIERIVKTEFEMEDIPEPNLNKIMAILSANQSNTVYENAYAFEKIVLSMSSKPVDFLDKQSGNVLVQDIVFTIDILDRVTPFDDIYDNFSNEVLNYIANVLSNKDMYIYNVANIVGSPMEPAFNQLLNEAVLKSIKDKMCQSSMSEELDKQVRENCEYVADNSHVILKAIRRYMAEHQEMLDVNRGDLVESIVLKRNIIPERVELIKKQVLLNLAIDDVLVMYENTLKTQLQKYQIARP